MRLYETLYLVRPDLTEESYSQLREKFQRVIQRQNGILVKEEVWGKRDLAYPVQKFMVGYYVLLHYAGEGGISFNLERELRLDESVMKYHTVKLSDRYTLEEKGATNPKQSEEMRPEEDQMEKGE